VSGTLDQIRKLVAQEQVLVSSHGYDELADAGIAVRDTARMYTSKNGRSGMTNAGSTT